jgi:hypothetical protein
MVKPKNLLVGKPTQRVTPPTLKINFQQKSNKIRAKTQEQIAKDLFNHGSMREDS